MWIIQTYIITFTDYKIISAILANRLKATITDITADQCGFIPGRIFADNIRQTLNVIVYAQIEKLDLFLLMLDAGKSFWFGEFDLGYILDNEDLEE